MRSVPMALSMALLVSSVFAHSVRAHNSVHLRTELEESLRLVDEAWHALDASVAEVWPTWSCYRDEIYFTAVPLVQDLMINPPEDPGNGFQLLDRKIQGKPVYLRDPGLEEKVWGGAHRFRINGERFWAAQFRPPANPAFVVEGEPHPKPLPRSTTQRRREKLAESAEHVIEVIVHEAFHRWQFRENKQKAINAIHPSPFTGNKVHDELLELEGRILATGYLSDDKEESAEIARQFLAVRRERRKFLTPEDINWERRNEYVEGSAHYVGMNVRVVLGRLGYAPKVLHKREGWFSAFDDYKALMEDNILRIKENSRRGSGENEARTRCYYFGLAQGNLLDQMCGQQWKTHFFEDGVYFETLLEKHSGFVSEMKAEYIQQAKDHYGT